LVGKMRSVALYMCFALSDTEKVCLEPFHDTSLELKELLWPSFCYQPHSMAPPQRPPASSAVGPAENYISAPLIPSLRILRVSSQQAGLSSANTRTAACRKSSSRRSSSASCRTTPRAGSGSYTQRAVMVPLHLQLCLLLQVTGVTQRAPTCSASFVTAG
jgi:hypothetical protein